MYTPYTLAHLVFWQGCYLFFIFFKLWKQQSDGDELDIGSLYCAGLYISGDCKNNNGSCELTLILYFFYWVSEKVK